MGPVILEIAPLALGIAASPFPVVPAILLLFTPRPRATGGSFLAGWVVGIVGVCGVLSALASVIERNEETPAWAPWTRLGLGVLLIMLGVQQWLKREKQTDPAWMRALNEATPATALRLGLLLSAANPKVLLLAAAGGRIWRGGRGPRTGHRRGRSDERSTCGRGGGLHCDCFLHSRAALAAVQRAGRTDPHAARSSKRLADGPQCGGCGCGTRWDRSPTCRRGLSGL